MSFIPSGTFDKIHALFSYMEFILDVITPNQNTESLLWVLVGKIEECRHLR